MRFLKPMNEESMKFLALAVLFMVVTQYFIFDGHGYQEKIKAEYYAEKAAEEARLKALAVDPVAEDYYTKHPPKMVYPEDGSLYFEQVPEEEVQP